MASGHVNRTHRPNTWLHRPSLRREDSPCQLGAVHTWHRQRHLAAGRDHVELARKQHHEATRMANATGDATGLIAGAPVEIGARRSDDRRSRILRNHQAAEGRGRLHALDRQIGFDEERRAVFVHPVDGDGAARRQRHPLRADRLAVVRQPGDAEEHVGAVGWRAPSRLRPDARPSSRECAASRSPCAR